MKRQFFYRWLALLFVITLSGAGLIFTSSLLGDIVSFLILVIGAMVIVNFNIAHPYVWYSFFFSLYTLGYPILLLTGENNPIYNYGYSKELIFIHWLALTSFLLIVTPRVVNIKGIRKHINNESFKHSKIVFWILTFLSLLYALYLSQQGFNTKGDLSNSDSFLVFAGLRILLVYTLIAGVQLTKSAVNFNRSKRSLYYYLLITFVTIFLVVFYSAERDLIFRYILIAFFVYYVFLYKRKHNFRLIIMAALLFLSIPISRSIKFLGLRGETVSLDSNIFIEFINSEFHTQSRNVQLLLNQDMYRGFFEGRSFYSAIPSLFNISEFSALRWFDNTFYSHTSTGMGFSLVGDGYVNLGYLGVIFMFVILGVVIKISYQKSAKNIYFFMIYLMSIPLAIYIIRADLNNFISQFFKQVCLVVLIYWLVDEIMARKKVKKMVVNPR